MERMPIVGFGLVFIAVLFGLITTSGFNLLPYVSLPGFLITVVGSFGAASVVQRTGNVKNFFLLIRKVFEKNEIETTKLIPRMLSLSEKARREGLLSLEDDVDEIGDPFLKFSLQLVIDGTDPEIIKTVLQKKIDSMENRHADNRKMFALLADLSPAFGLFGTVVGLIFMLTSLGGDISVIGRGMSTALLTTLYGVILANGIWTPITNRLASKTEQEILQKTIIIEGVISIQFGDNPRVLRQKLQSFFSDRSEVSE